MDLFHIGHETTALLHGMNDEELRSFAELQEDPANDEQTELYIYIYLFVFKRTSLIEHLRPAVLRAEGWLAETAVEYPDRARRFDILNMMSTLMRPARTHLRKCYTRGTGDSVS
jgi:hypothetical protein